MVQIAVRISPLIMQIEYAKIIISAKINNHYFAIGITMNADRICKITFP